MTSAERVLVTGGAGFVGANLVRRLLHEGAAVHVLVGERSDEWRLTGVLEDIDVWRVDLRDRERVENAVAAIRPDRVFHLAAHGGYSSQRDVHAILESNVLGTTNVVEASLRSGVASIVHTGSSSEYGYRDHAPTEAEPVEPNSYYAVGKAAATMYCRYASAASGVPITTLRLYSVYGPWEEPSRLFPRLLIEGLEGRWPPLVSPRTARDYVYVDDVVDACIAAAAAPLAPLGSVFNIASGQQTTLAELADVAGALQPRTSAPQWGSMPGRDWDSDTWVGDPSAAAHALGWRAATGLASGYARTLTWLTSGNGERAAEYRARSAPGARPPMSASGSARSSVGR